MESNTTTPEDIVVGTKTYTCVCGDEQTVEITLFDIKQGYAQDYCARSNHLNTIEIERLPGRPESKVRANSLNSNYPDGFGGF